MFAFLPPIPNVYYGTESYPFENIYVSSPRIVLSQVGDDCLVIIFEILNLAFDRRFKFRKARYSKLVFNFG